MGAISYLRYNIDKQKHTIPKLVRYTKKNKAKKRNCDYKNFFK